MFLHENIKTGKIPEQARREGLDDRFYAGFVEALLSLVSSDAILAITYFFELHRSLFRVLVNPIEQGLIPELGVGGFHDPVTLIGKIEHLRLDSLAL